MFGQMHSLTQKTSPGKILWGLSLPQVIIILLGARLSYSLSEIIPALPVNNFIIAHIHHLIPLFFCVFVLFVRQSKTNLSIGIYFYYWLLFKFRKKTFVWKRS